MWTEHRFVSFDKTPIFYRYRATQEPLKGIVLMAHGMGEHGGRYRAFADYLAEMGLVSIVPDLRGFGKSGGKKACIKRFTDFYKDLAALHSWAHRQYKETPLFLFGHSFGGLIASSYLAFYPHPKVSGLILSSPIFGVAVPIPLWRHLLGVTVSYLTPDYTQDSRVDPKTLTHDQAILEAYAKDPSINHQISARLYRELVRQMARRETIAKNIHTPVLIVQADEDKVVLKDRTVQFFNELNSQDKEMEIYPGFYHEVLNEIDRSTVYSRVGRWILSHISHN